MPRAPTPEDVIAARMARRAAEDMARTALPEAGRRLAIKPDRIAAIRWLAAKGYGPSEIARRLDLHESGVRRDAGDYGITLSIGSCGPGARTAARVEARRREVAGMLEAGLTQRAIAAKLGMSTFTICQDAQYARERGWARRASRGREK
jgi:DNA-binding NarL/FixJ family response regulator